MIPLCLLCISSLSSCWFFPPFSSPSLSSPLQCTPAIPVVPCGLWFADRAGRQRSLRVTRDKSCFSALRTDTSQLCSLQIAEICWLGGGGFEVRGRRGACCSWLPLPTAAEVKMTLPCERGCGRPRYACSAAKLSFLSCLNLIFWRLCWDASTVDLT